jgi:hypothetical protein
VVADSVAPHDRIVVMTLDLLWMACAPMAPHTRHYAAASPLNVLCFILPPFCRLNLVFGLTAQAHGERATPEASRNL